MSDLRDPLGPHSRVGGLHPQLLPGPPSQTPPVTLPCPLALFLFTKVERGPVWAGEEVCKGLLPTGLEKGERGWGYEVGPAGRVLGPLEGSGSVPQFRLLYFEGPRPPASALGAAQARGAVWAVTPRIRAPASQIRCCCCRCCQPRAAPGQVGGALRPPMEEGTSADEGR